MRTLNTANTSYDIAIRIKEFEDSLKPKPVVEHSTIESVNIEPVDDGLTDNLRRYKKEKLENIDKNNSQISVGTLYLLAFLLLPTVIGTFIVVSYMQYRFYQKYANYRPIDLRYKDYYDF